MTVQFECFDKGVRFIRVFEWSSVRAYINTQGPINK